MSDVRTGAPAVPSKLVGLQMLRAVAATLVVVDHAMLWLVAKGLIPGGHNGQIAIGFGDTGVYAFFVISGFIMLHAHEKDFGADRQRRFARKRLIRIVPMYWIATIVAIAHALIKGNGLGGAARVLGSFAFVTLTNAENGPMRPVLEQGWTLTYEMMFYILFGLALGLPKRFGLALVTFAIGAIILLGAFWKPLDDLSGPRSMMVFYTNPIMALFLIGFVVHALRGRITGRVPGAAPAAILLLVGFSLGGADLRTWLANDCLFRAIEYLVAGIAILLGVLHRSGSDGRFGLLLERLGDSSYSVYLFHVLICMGLGQALLHVGSRPGIGFYVLACIIVANLLGLVINHFVERPLTAYLSGRSTRAIVRDASVQNV